MKTVSEIKKYIELIQLNKEAGNHPPKGPFRILHGKEYTLTFEEMNRFNRRLHNADESLRGLDFHEIHPVKFGGEPTDPTNKILLSRTVHLQFVKWWNKKLYELKDSL